MMLRRTERKRTTMMEVLTIRLLLTARKGKYFYC